MTCCPYGPAILLPLVLAAVGTITTFYAAFDCNFFSAPGVGQLSVMEININYGLWSVQDVFNVKGSKAWGGNIKDIGYVGSKTPCVLWNQQKALDVHKEPDDLFRFARIAIMIAGGLSVVALIWVVRGIFTTIDLIYLLAATMIGATVFAALALMALKSNLCPNKHTCHIGLAGIMSIVSAVVWVVTAGLSICLLKHTYAYVSLTFVLYFALLRLFSLSLSVCDANCFFMLCEQEISGKHRQAECTLLYSLVLITHIHIFQL